MDGYRRSSSSVKPSTVAKPSSSGRADRCTRGTFSEEIKENDQQFHEGAELIAWSLKKEHKNYTPTTISAASKKKILVEKKDAPSSECSGTYSEKNPEIRKSGLVYNQPDAAPQVPSFPSGLHRSGEETVVSSETQPYDPLTNYLSPRPKFLRYNPDRRRKIYLRRESEFRGTEGSSGFDPSLSFEVESTSSEGAPSDPPASPSLKLEGLDVMSLQDEETHENMEVEDDDDTLEVEEEERPPCCTLVWKSLLLLGVLFVLTCYISSVHPPPSESSLRNFQFSRGSLFKIQVSFQEVGENAGTNLDKYVGSYMNATMQSQFNELANWGYGINNNRLGGLPKSTDFKVEKLQDEGNVKAVWVENVKSNTSRDMVEGRTVESEQLQDESEVAMAEGSDLLLDIPLMAAGEIEEHASYREEDSYQIGENEVSAMYEQHVEDLITESETEETDDVTEEPSEPEKSSQEEAVSGHDEEDNKWDKNPLSKLQDISSPPSFPDTMENANALIYHRIKVCTTVLMVLTVAASTIIHFLRFRRTKDSNVDFSVPCPNTGPAAKRRTSSELTEVMKTEDKSFSFLVNAHEHKGLHESLAKFVDSSADTEKPQEPYERNPPTVKLLGEFSVVERGTSETKNPMSRRKTIRNEEPNQSPLPFLGHESASCRTPSPEELVGKQSNGQRQETAKVAPTPVRRSSRIRNRVASPGA